MASAGPSIKNDVDNDVKNDEALDLLHATEVDVDSDSDSYPSRKINVSKRKVSQNATASRTTKQKTNTRSHIGKLSRLNTIPTDVFLEIASYLQPLDILHMARTTKAWRATLISKSSKPIWTAARISIPELPACPDDLSEPEYTRLMFESDCYVCGTKNVPWTSFELRKRVCKACSKDNLIRHDKVVALAGHRAELIKMLIPSCTGAPHSRSADTHYFKADINDMLSFVQSRSFQENRIIYTKERCDLLARIRARPENLQRFQLMWRTTLSREYDEAARRRDQKKVDRKAEIVRRFVALGYDEVDVRFGYPNQGEHVKKALVLTETAWTKIRPILETEVIENRDRRLVNERDARQRERQDELKALYSSLPSHVLLLEGTETAVTLRLIDFYGLPSIQALWRDRSAALRPEDFPSAEVICSEVASFSNNVKKDLQNMLHCDMRRAPTGAVDEKLMEQYRGAIKGRLFNQPWADPADLSSPLSELAWNPKDLGLRNLMPSAEESATDLPSLNHPMSVFACCGCHEVLLWPTMMTHSHAYPHFSNPDARSFSPKIPWNPGFVYTWPLLRQIMAKVVGEGQKVGLNISTVQSAGHFRVECLSCDATARQIWTPTEWQTFVKHVRDAYYWERSTAEFTPEFDDSESSTLSSTRAIHQHGFIEKMAKVHPPGAHSLEALRCSVTRITAPVV